MGKLKHLWRTRRPELISGLLYRIVLAVGATLRVETQGFPKDLHNSIICGWHGKSFVFAHRFRGRGYWVIISHSRDGDMQNDIFTRLGFRTIRGSTGRGGVRAAVESIRALRDGGTMAITPDGPRGPSGIVQGGVMLMAHKSGARLIPVGISARPRWIAKKSWDRYMVPMPFARAVLIAGEPLQVPPNATEEEIEAIRLEFQSRINVLEDEADRRLGLTMEVKTLPAAPDLHSASDQE